MTPAAKHRLLLRVQSAAAVMALLDARGEADDQAGPGPAPSPQSGCQGRLGRVSRG